MNPIKRISWLKISTMSGLLLGGFALSVVAQTIIWQGPPDAPPNCVSGYPGCDAPINVGGEEQTRTGRLRIGTFNGPSTEAETALKLNVNGPIRASELLTDTLTVFGGNPGPNKILAAATDRDSSGQPIATGRAYWASTAANSFTFKRSPPYGSGTPTSGYTKSDAITWCPASHPRLIYCGVIDEQASGFITANPDELAGYPFSPLTKGQVYKNSLPSCAYSSSSGVFADGLCDTSGKRTALGTAMIYTEIVKGFNEDTPTNIQGCLTYDHAHIHKPYRVDLICSN